MQLAHAGGHHLLGLRDRDRCGRWRPPGRSCACAGELGLVAAALGRDGQADHRRGEGDGRHRQFAQRHAGVQVFHLGHGHDRRRARPRRWAASRWPARGTAGPILSPLRTPDHRNGLVLLQRARVDADEIDLLHEGVDAGLEDLGHQRAGRVGLHLHLLAGGVGGRAGDHVRRQARRRPGRPTAPASPTPVLAETHTMGIRLPAATA